MAIPYLTARTIRRAAKLHKASFSAAPGAYGHERVLRPSLAGFSRPAGTICSAGDR